jgi:hypothetical protein
MVAVLLVANVAMADNISVYSDATGTSCVLAAGFTSTAAVLHKFAQCSYGSRFKVSFPAGTSYFAFTSSFTTIGNLLDDLSFGYGTQQVGSIVLGTITAILANGTISVLKADSQATILYLDCNFAELEATGGNAYVGTTGPCPVPTQPSTWGQVKALYR